MLSEKALFDGTLIITDNQTAGKGQAGNSWNANPNENITLSLVLKPNFIEASEQFWLNMVISLGIFDFVSSKINIEKPPLTPPKKEGDKTVLFPREESKTPLLPKEGLGLVTNNKLVKIKWSNDIFIDDKKVAGILIQNLLSGKNINYSIIGIGLNINQLNFNIPTATSLLLASGNAIASASGNVHADTYANAYNVRVCVEELLSFLEKRYFQLKENKIVFKKQSFYSKKINY